MARPQKEGVDYFPVVCQFDDKVKLIQAEFGLIGLGVLIRLWQKIYGGKGYYTAWSNDVALVFASECGVSANVVKEIISACMRRGLFDRQKFDDYHILTSEGIQERYAEATERRVSQKIDGRYLLIDIPSNWVLVGNNAVNVDTNAINDCNNTQSKVNKNKSHYNTTTPRARAREQHVNPSLGEVIDKMKECGVENATRQAFDFLVYNEERGWDCLPDWEDAAERWVERMR
jgi:nucleoside diphosphate kinase